LLQANELLGSQVLEKIRQNSSSIWVFSAYVSAVLLNEKTLSTFRERERFFSSIAAAASEWALPLISTMTLDAPSNLQDFLFRYGIEQIFLCAHFEMFKNVLCHH
jgi:hypothetical protein